MEKVIYYLGNAFVPEDSLAIKVAKKLHGVRCEPVETFDALMEPKESIYMDVCEGIDKAQLIQDIEVFAKFKRTTAHDVDFGFFLQLAHEMQQLKNIHIIALPKKAYAGLVEDVQTIVEGLS